MDMKALIAKMDQLTQVDEETKKKPDADGDGVPDWADKKPGKDDNDEKEDDKEKVDEAIAIQADGSEAMALLDMLKLAGRPAPQESACGCGMTEEDSDPAYSNTPDEHVSDMSAATPSGNDMHAEKDAWRAAAGADNPMIAAMEGKLKKMFESFVNETAYDADLKDNDPVKVSGVKGAKSKEFTKKFKNMAAYAKWSESEDATDYEVTHVEKANR